MQGALPNEDYENGIPGIIPTFDLNTIEFSVSLKFLWGLGHLMHDRVSSLNDPTVLLAAP